MRARDNPFAVSCILAVRYRLDDTGWASLLRRLEEMQGRAAIVGPHGSGKTTLLEDMAPRLEAWGYRIRWIRLSEERRTLEGPWADGLSNQDFILLDGAEQLGGWAWSRFRWRSRRAGGVVITSHRHGRFPTLHRCVTDAGLLAEIIRRLVGDARHWAVQSSPELFARHHGNIREALRELYDRCADLKNGNGPLMNASHLQRS